jgi:hypothetical protein
MSPSEQCKKSGLDSLSEFVRISGESEQNLLNWYKKRPLRFRLLLSGCVNEKRELEKDNKK